MSDIYIVSPPFSPIEWPSLGIGQLVASAKHAGLDAKALYLSLRFAKRIGYSLYSFIIGPVKSEILFGEYFFSNAALNGSHLSYSKYPMHTITGNSLTADIMRLYAKKDPNFWETFKELPRIAEKFIKISAQEITRENPRVVGCSTSFQQYNASLALLRHIKRLNPDVITVLGGANCEAEIGYITLKNFSWIDFVVSGEADSLFPKLCHTIYKYGTKIPSEKLPYGVYSREKFSAALATSNNGLRSISETAIEHNLDNVPIPDYSDYFEELQRIRLNQEFKPLLIMETSRGCWKGSRKPCNFCGLNGMRSAYRQKSSERVLHELAWLSETYGIRKFKTADCILSMNYFSTLFKTLAQQKAPYKLNFETSSSLSERQVKALADAGVVWIQPGIESLHDELLKLLNKGNSAIHNIALLKYAFENGIEVRWNILVGIPGELNAYYQEMVKILPLLYHLQPPDLVPIRFDRFSEYFEKSELFGLTLIPYRYYQYVYPFKHEDLETFAYFFEDAAVCDNDQSSSFTAEKRELRLLVYQTWRNAFYNIPKAELLLSVNDHHTVISDTRPCAVAPEFRLTGIEHFIYRGCRKPVPRSVLYRSVCQAYQSRMIDKHVFDQSLEQLLKKKLLLHINGKFLALATFKPKRILKKPPNRLEHFLNRVAQKQITTTSSQTTNKTWEWFASLAAND